MELEEKAEEILELLWIYKENKGEASVSLVELEGDDGEGMEQLITAGYVTVEFERVRLTERGTPLARNVVRRHRLAERLLADVMGTGDQLMHEKACKFEHLLDHGLEENICSLLGHPKICPHGKPIPPGACCRRHEKQGKQGQRVVSLLSQLNPGQAGKVGYIYAPEAEQLQRLTAMGILPGAPIVLTQNFPSYTFHVGQTQFAVDEEIANSIYVRLINPDNNLETTKT